MTTQSKRLIGAELILSILIIFTLIWQRDSGWDAIGIAFIYRPTLQIILICFLIFHVISVLRRQGASLGRFLLKILYLMVVIFVLISSFLFQNDIMYSREIIDFNLNKPWFEEIAVIAPNLSHCSTPTEFSCQESISLPQEDQRQNYMVEVVTYEEILVIIVDSRQYVSYVHLAGQSGLPQVSLGRYKVGCDYELSEDWYVCGIGGDVNDFVSPKTKSGRLFLGLVQRACQRQAPTKAFVDMVTRCAATGASAGGSGG